MKPQAWRELLWPGGEEADPRFRAEIDRLSVVGLRVIAAVSVAANLLGYFLWLLWMPSIPEWMALSDLLAGLIIIAAAVGLFRVVLHLKVIDHTLEQVVGGVEAIADKTSTVPTVV